MTLAAVSDAGPIIHLAEIDALELLAAFDPLLIPETVYEEIERGGVPDGISDLRYESVEAGVDSVESEALDAGERAAIAVASERGVLLLTDDLEARTAAADSGIEVHGSIGVIALSYAHGSLEKVQAVSLMRTLQEETSLFVTEAVVERGIQMLGEY